MKINYPFFLLLTLVINFVFFTGCKDDEVVNDQPDIILSTTRASLADIKLNENTGPTIRGWGVAEAGLGQVLIVAETTAGTVELLNINSFTPENSEMNGTRYNFAVLPEYNTSFNAIIITVSDVLGRSKALTLDVGATGGDAGPDMSGFETGGVRANIRESVNVRPAIQGSVSSHFGLASVRYVAVYGEVEEELQVISDFGDTPNEYEVNFVPDYNDGFQKGMTAIIIEGTDARGFKSEVTIPVTIIDEDPAPVITFDEESIEANLTSNPQETPEVAGSVDSEYIGLAEVRFYLIYGGEDIEIEEEAIVFEENNEEDGSLEFSFIPEYSLGVSGIKVVAKDDNGQTSSSTLPVTVIANDPDLHVHMNVNVNAQAKRNDDGVATAFSADGETYTLAEGLDANVSENIDFISTDSGGDNGLDLFSPSHETWLPGNYFKKDVTGDMTWPVLNETRMVHLQDKGEAYFNSASSIDIRALSVGEDYNTRIEFGPDDSGNHMINQVILFENSRGQKGLLLFKESDNAAGKEDKFTFDIKVINE